MSKVYVTYSKDDNSTTGVYATQFGAIKAAKENGYGHGIDFFELVGREELDWESLKAAFDTVISTAPEAIKNAYESEDFKKAINELRNASSTNKGIEYFIVTAINLLSSSKVDEDHLNKWAEEACKGRENSEPSKGSIAWF